MAGGREGQRQPHSAHLTYFNKDTASFEEVVSRSTQPATSPVWSRQWMTSLTRMLPIELHAVSATSNTLTLVFAGRSGDTLTASRRMIVPPPSKTTRSSVNPENSSDPGLVTTR